MNTANLIALYAAIVGTAALAWQATVYLTERRPKIRVNANLLHILMTRDEQRKVFEQIVDYPWQLMIGIVNIGKYSVRIENMEIETNRSEKDVDVWRLKRWHLPWLLDSGETKEISVTNEDVGALARAQELRVKITTSTGKKFYSRLIQVNKGGAAMIPVKDYEELLQAIPESERPAFTQKLHLFGFDDEPHEFGLGDTEQ
jgi:hypothetical protein